MTHSAMKKLNEKQEFPFSVDNINLVLHLHDFSCSCNAGVTRFPTLTTSYTFFSRAFNGLHVFPRPFERVTCFPALATGYMFSRAYNGLHVFPPLQRFTFFPALTMGYMFSRASRRLHVFLQVLIGLMRCLRPYS